MAHALAMAALRAPTLAAQARQVALLQAVVAVLLHSPREELERLEAVEAALLETTALVAVAETLTLETEVVVLEAMAVSGSTTTTRLLFLAR